MGAGDAALDIFPPPPNIGLIAPFLEAGREGDI